MVVRTGREIYQPGLFFAIWRSLNANGVIIIKDPAQSNDTSSNTTAPPRRTSARLAYARANADATSTQAPGSDKTAPGRSRQSLQVAVPVKNLPVSRASSSRSSVVNSSGDGTNQHSTPATSVAITPVESDGNKPNKRVSASARARELQASTKSLGAQRGRKRAASLNLTTEDLDEALARALQAEEYGEHDSKRQKLSHDEDMSDMETESTEGLSAFESPDSRFDGERRPRDKYGRKIYRVPQIDFGYVSEDGSDEISDSDDDLPSVPSTSAWDDDDHVDELAPPPIARNGNSRNANSRAASTRTANARNTRSRRSGRVSMAGRPFWMSNRVSQKGFFSDSVLISYAGMEGTKEARRAAPDYHYNVG